MLSYFSMNKNLKKNSYEYFFRNDPYICFEQQHDFNLKKKKNKRFRILIIYCTTHAYQNNNTVYVFLNLYSIYVQFVDKIFMNME